MNYCAECGQGFEGAGFPIGNLSSPNCGNCYGFVDGVHTEDMTNDELIRVHHNKIALDKLQDDLQAVFDGSAEQISLIINEFIVGNLPWLSGEQQD
jgi:hypothetical protein